MRAAWEKSNVPVIRASIARLPSRCCRDDLDLFDPKSLLSIELPEPMDLHPASDILRELLLECIARVNSNTGHRSRFHHLIEHEDNDSLTLLERAGDGQVNFLRNRGEAGVSDSLYHFRRLDPGARLQGDLKVRGIEGQLCFVNASLAFQPLDEAVSSRRSRSALDAKANLPDVGTRR